MKTNGKNNLKVTRLYKKYSGFFTWMLFLILNSATILVQTTPQARVSGFVENVVANEN